MLFDNNRSPIGQSPERTMIVDLNSFMMVKKALLNGKEKDNYVAKSAECSTCKESNIYLYLYTHT